MNMNKLRSMKNSIANIDSRGFTLVEVLIIIMVIPLVLGVSFGVMSAALSIYRVIDARSGLASTGTHMLEMFGQDIRGLAEIYNQSSENRLYGRIYGAQDVDYQFTPSSHDSPGALTRNGINITRSGVGVESCEFEYLRPAEGSDAPNLPEPQESSAYESVLPSLASCVKVKFTLDKGTSSMTFESIFHMRNS
jgi:hypothetical protein